MFGWVLWLWHATKSGGAAPVLVYYPAPRLSTRVMGDTKCATRVAGDTKLVTRATANTKVSTRVKPG